MTFRHLLNAARELEEINLRMSYNPAYAKAADELLNRAKQLLRDDLRVVVDVLVCAGLRDENSGHILRFMLWCLDDLEDLALRARDRIAIPDASRDLVDTMARVIVNRSDARTTVAAARDLEDAQIGGFSCLKYLRAISVAYAHYDGFAAFAEERAARTSQIEKLRELFPRCFNPPADAVL